MDAISPILDTFRLSASVFERARFCGNWALTHEGRRQASFHLVTAGRCWLDRRDGQAPLPLDPGDLLVLPRDAPHRLGPASEIGADHEPDRQPLAEAGPGTGLICGYFAFDEGTNNPLLDALPDYLLLRDTDIRDNPTLHGLVHLLVVEAGREEDGVAAMINRLSDALFIETVRHHLATADTPVGLLAGLADPVVARALQAIHNRPAETWTAGKLAAEAAASRSTLAERFSRTLGVGPMTYLFQWRMQIARRRLRDGEPIARVAEQCGYASESGFSKAFARHFGEGPGLIRRRGRHGERTGAAERRAARKAAV